MAGLSLRRDSVNAVETGQLASARRLGANGLISNSPRLSAANNGIPVDHEFRSRSHVLQLSGLVGAPPGVGVSWTARRS